MTQSGLLPDPDCQIDVAPDDLLEEVLEVAKRKIIAGDFAGGEALCRAALERFPDIAALHALLAHLCQHAQRPDEAVRHGDAALARDAECWLAHHTRCLALATLGRWAEARAAADAAGQLLPLDLATFEMRLELTARLDGPAAAFVLHGTAPAELRRQLPVAQLEELAGHAAAAAIAPGITALRTLLDANDFRGAESQARQALLRFPETAQLHGVLAYSLEEQNRLEEALAASITATDYDPADWFGLFARGEALRLLGRPAEARAVFARAVMAHPEDVHLRRQLLITTMATRGVHAARAVIEAAGPAARAGAPGRIWRTLLVDAGEPDEPPPGTLQLVAKVEPAFGWARRNGVPVIDAGPVEALPFAAPRIWGAAEPGPPVLVQGYRPYAVELPDAVIAAQSSLIVTRDGCVLNDVTGDADHGDAATWPHDRRVLAQSGRAVMLDLASHDMVEIEGGVMLSGQCSRAFGHWMPEYLCRLPWLERHPAFRELPLIIDDGMPQSHLDYLRLVSDRPVLTLPATAAVRCRRLLYAPPRSFFPVELVRGHRIPAEERGILSVSAMGILRDRVLARLPAAGPGRHRWFLGRRNLKWRLLSNETEVATALEPLGFRTVYPEDLTLARQIDLFREAEAIVAPNGSALLNLIFAPADIVLIVLAQADLFNWGSVQGPMEALGYRPLWVCASAEAPSKHADYVVDPAAVLGALASRGIA